MRARNRLHGVTALTSYEVELEKTRGSARSPKWPTVRAAWVKEHPLCMGCGTRDHVEVHHIKPFHLFPALELDPSNLITLCEHPGHDCHFRCGHGYNWSHFNDDVIADAAYDRGRVAAIAKSNKGD